MRIRSIKPEFYKSDDIDALTWEQRLVFIGLWSYVDDNGVGIDKLSSIVADLFAADHFGDPHETVRRVSSALEAIQEQGLITRYRVKGKPFLYVIKWDGHQRVTHPNKPRFPRPSSDSGDPQEDSRESPESFVPVTGLQGSRGTEVQGSRGTSPADAATFPKTTELAIAQREDVNRLCTHLADRIEGNGSKRPPIGKTWHDSARLMLDRDGRTEQEIHGAIDWSQSNEFWRPNIMSMPKLREKYDTLRLQAQKTSNKPQRGDIDWDAAFERAKQRDAHATSQKREIS